jgi:drug/metabolite transporter (DMT)-like permease
MLYQRRRPHTFPSPTTTTTTKNEEDATKEFHVVVANDSKEEIDSDHAITRSGLSSAFPSIDKRHPSRPNRDATPSSSSSLGSTPPPFVVWGNAALYVLSGCSQPLIMTLCKNAGLADPGCQLYMFFYALGPAMMMVPWMIMMMTAPSSSSANNNNYKRPSIGIVSKAAAICTFDIVCTVANYTGASLAGPTIFSIVYSSVTIWTALFSQLFLKRRLRRWQWIAIVAVFVGLAMTATGSLQLEDQDNDVSVGFLLILVGSAMHALTYIMSEGIMTVSKETLSVRENNAIQSAVAATTLGLWQLVYTLPRWEEKIQRPMEAAETTSLHAAGVMLAFALSNLVHSSTFFYTLRHFPGGSTSAGVMKGLQAVLVFVVTHFAYCGRTGGPEMCFTRQQFLSLVTVSGGVMAYGVATRHYHHSHSTTEKLSMTMTTTTEVARRQLGRSSLSSCQTDIVERQLHVPDHIA